MTSLKESLYDYSVENTKGETVSLGAYRGSVALVVNTASKCGFTGQYKNLEELYRRFKERGFVVLAFPSNDFGAQEPGNNTEIEAFCELNFETSFPIFSKAAVSGEGKQPVYAFLTEGSAEEFRGDPGWNFVKFLVDREGKVAGRFSSMRSPTSKAVTEQIEKLLVP